MPDNGFKSIEGKESVDLNMTPGIEKLSEKKLIGNGLTMSFADYKAGELWGSFMQRRKEIASNLTNGLISVAVYKPNHFADFRPTNEFERWATVDVADFANVPADMETFLLPGGLYAVFNHKGGQRNLLRPFNLF